MAFLAAACSVPEFSFDQPVVVETGGDGSVVVVVPHCRNGELDSESGESDFDCGRGCLPCGAGKHCTDVADCATDLLCHDGTCLEPGCMNQVQDGEETDEDCGGSGCKPCIVGQSCGVGADCETGVCENAKCLAASCDDQVENGKETAMDCGGGDCPACAVDQPCLLGKDCISGECNGNVCGAECADGFANCDKKNDNACEVNTRTDAENCGFCGNACQLPHAAAECSAGECRIKTDGCEVGFQDCNGDPADGCEVDLKTNKLNCGACHAVCPDLNGDPSCVAGTCQITCNDGFADCDDKRDNGCEINLKNSSKNCNACGKKCAADPGNSAYCKDGTCGQTTCAAGKGDCNGEAVDACETTLTNDVDNCGACGNKCEAVNANVDCVKGVCVITGCKGNFADCGGGFDDGCETNTDTSTSHCGGCGKGCTVSNGSPKCDAGSCEVNSCSGTFRDCNGDPKDGCEINIANNAKVCGGCGAQGTDCTTKYANASSSCTTGACTAPVCNSGFGDCSGGAADGCETNVTKSPSNCGTCGNVCSTDGTHVSANVCSNSQCVPTCSGPYLTCDNKGENGCEVNGDDNQKNCGDCGIACNDGASAHVVSNPCAGGACSPQCSGTFGDCDTSRQNGCETDTAVSTGNCGGCGKVCKTDATAHVSANTCSGSSCHPTCSGLFDDCDSSRENGCEKDVSGDKSNCGSCDTVCGTSHASVTACSAGKCDPTCTTGWGKCTTPELGCVTPLGTTANCTKCGQACTGSTPFCDPGGCVDHRDIVVAPSGVHGIAGWNGSGAASVLTVDHTLTYGKGNSRMVLVGVASSDTLLDPESVKYDDFDMVRAQFAQDSSNQSYAAVYYLLDDQLPDTAGATSHVKVTFSSGSMWGDGGFDVLELKNTMQVAPIANGTAVGGNCGGGNGLRSVSVTFNQPGSLVYGVMSGRGATQMPVLSAGPTQHWNEHVGSPTDHTGSSAYVLDDNNRTFDWTFNDCFNSAGVAVVIKRLNAN